MAVKFSQFNVGTTISDIDYIVGYKSTNNVQIPIGLVVPSVDGSGTANYITKWTDADTIGDSVIYDDGTNVGIGTTSPTELLHIHSGDSGGTANVAADEVFIEGSGDTGITISSPSTNAGVLAFGDNNVSYRGALIYNHPDDSMLFRVSSNTRMTIDSGGNVGFNETPENSNGTWRNFQIGGANIASRFTGNNDGFFGTGYVFKTDNSEVYKNTEAVSRVFFNNDIIEFQQAASGTAGTAISWDIPLKIDSSGNVGIGTTSPDGKLDISLNYGTAWTSSSRANNFLQISNTSPNAGTYSGIELIATGTGSAGAAEIVCIDAGSSKGDLAFSTRNITWGERMRITSGGDLYINTTSGAGENKDKLIYSPVASWLVQNHSTARTSGSHYTLFYYGTTAIGSITQSGTTGVSYNETSDYRLKENVVPITGALDRVDALKPSRFNFIADADITVDGFLAHELAEVVPEAVTGEKDAVDEEGNAIYQGIDKGKIVPLLVGAIQELRAEIETLKSQINN